MARYYQSPDTRLAHIRAAEEREEERSRALDEQDAQREQDIQRQMQVEMRRSAALDEQDMGRRQDIDQQMQTEVARGQRLDAMEAQEWEPTAIPAPRPTTPYGGPLMPTPSEITERGPGLLEMGMGALERFRTRVTVPAGASLMQVLETRAGATTAGGVGGAPLRPRPISEVAKPGVVVAPEAWFGDEEEQVRAQEVMEEAGLIKSLVFEFIADPTLLLPGPAGFTKIDDVVRFIRTGAKLTGKARQAWIQSPKVRQLVNAIGAEAGGPKVPKGVPERPLIGVEEPQAFPGITREAVGERMAGWEPPGPPRRPTAQMPPEPSDWQAVAAKVAERFPESRKIYKNIKLARRAEMTGRTREYFKALDEQLGKGVDLEEAKRVAKQQYTGEMPDIEFAEAFITTPDELAALNGRGLEYARETGRVHEWEDAYTAIANMADKRVPRPHEIKYIRRIYGDALADAIEKAAKDKDWWETAMDLWMLPKAIRSSFDISFPGRQGIIPGFRHPLMWSKGVVNSVRAYKNPDWMLGQMKKLLDDPTPYGIKMADGSVQDLRFGDILDGMGVVAKEVEPYYRGQLAEKIPFIGRHVYRSRVSFTGVGNQFRADMTRHWLNTWKRSGVDITPERLEKLGTLMNALTGRASIPKGWLFELLQATWWSPQYRLSAPQVVGTMVKHGLGAIPRGGGRPLIASADPHIAGIAAQNLVAYIGGGIGILAAVKTSGLADVELDPRSSDFGKVKLGPTRINFWGTSQLLVRTIAQTITGTRIDPELGPQAQLRHEPSLRYWQSGASPQFQLVTNAITGETYLGERIYPSEERGISPEDIARREATETTLPLAWLDLKEAIEEDAVRGGLIGGLGMIGIGVQSYEPRAAQELQNIPEFTGGLDQREINDIREFWQRVDEIRDEWRMEGQSVDDLSWADSIRYVAELEGKDENWIGWAVGLRSKKNQDRLRNPEWIQFIVENADEIKEDRPDILRRNYIINAIRESQRAEAVAP